MTAWVTTICQYAIVVSRALEGSVAVGRSKYQPVPVCPFKVASLKRKTVAVAVAETLPGTWQLAYVCAQR